MFLKASGSQYIENKLSYMVFGIMSMGLSVKAMGSLTLNSVKVIKALNWLSTQKSWESTRTWKYL